MSAVAPPLALLAELTHRCPLRCPYCSNPTSLHRATDELDTDTWRRVFDEAADLGVLQIHFSGGEPTARRDLVELVAHASGRELYCNLITSGIGTRPGLLARLAHAGLEHVQLSIQSADDSGDAVAGLPGAQAIKRAFAAQVKELGFAFTINVVVHRDNLPQLSQLIALAASFGANRLEIAHVQYHGWALTNRQALMPTREQLAAADHTVAQARTSYRGTMSIDYVPADYFEDRPKACMAGWGQRFLCVTPAGAVLPCQGAETLPGLHFPSVQEANLAQIWEDSDAFNRFRGTSWMPEPCRSCGHRERDWGGCRCQAFALVGNPAATDPVCDRSPHHKQMGAVLRAGGAEKAWIYRGASRLASGTR
jgi:pyrroloquinoline quinone biosynthesis protein E